MGRTLNQVFTLGRFADFSSYFFPLFSTLLLGTSRTDLRMTRPERFASEGVWRRGSVREMIAHSIGNLLMPPSL